MPRLVVAVLAVFTFTTAPSQAAAATNLAFSFAGTGQPGFSGDNQQASTATFRSPFGIAALRDGSVLVSDRGDHRVRKIAPDGVITTFAGNGIADFTGDGGPANVASLDSPGDVVELPDGSVLIADTDNNRIRRVSPAGIISTFAGNGVSPSGGDGGAAISAGIGSPTGLAVTPDGDVLVTQASGQHRVRRITPDGAISTLIGNGTATNNGDGAPLGPGSTIQAPQGIDAGADGSIYIASTAGNRVRRISPTGVVSTLLGNGTADSTGDGRPAVAATTNAPGDVLVAPDGSVLVAESTGCKVRRIDPSGIVTRIAGQDRRRAPEPATGAPRWTRASSCPAASRSCAAARCW